ncbi:hypothetical protein ACNHKD_15210 [Methylocystis sp. JAN1]|uniref:hypothetical protein n=1 Tax=Methylocystis sp. JAN1 TaxID=3397211 RepID=UPI003FA1F4F5
MGEVVAFRRREKSSRDEGAPSVGDAQILFFLGVRYARMDAPLDAGETLSPDRGEGRSHGQGPRGGKKRKARARA